MQRAMTWAQRVGAWLAILRGPQVWRQWPFVVLVLVMTWLMGLSIGEIPENINEDAVAPYDIRADRQYTIVNDKATEQLRSEAMADAKTVYDFDLGVVAQLVQRIHAAFALARDAIATQGPGAVHQPSLDFLPNVRARFEQALGSAVGDAAWEQLVGLQWSEMFEHTLQHEVKELLAGPVVSDAEQLKQERAHGIVLRTMPLPGGDPAMPETTLEPEKTGNILSLDDVRARVQFVGPVRYHKSLVEFTAALLRPNCSANLLETELRRAKRMASVVPVTLTVNAGEMIARRFERYSARQVMLLTAIQHQKTTGSVPLQTGGHFLFVSVVIGLLHRFGRQHLYKYRPRRTDLIFLGSLLCVMVVTLRAGGMMGDALAEGLHVAIPATAFYYLIPVAMGGMMVRFLLNAEMAILMSVAVAAFGGMLLPQDPGYTAFLLIVNLAGASSIAHADKRSSIVRAGVWTGFVAMCTVLAMHLMRAAVLSEMLTLETLAWHVGMALGGALFASFLVLALTPVAETVFGYTSDIKLLELANLNHPLLRELVIRAPGTYHHSHLVGILAESAAGAIGANTLLARVGAYYHDVGKIRKPSYFTENLKGASPHDRLSPHMSALIIASHVKEGIELARLHKLPQQIIDMIPQHHGTKRIGYFFERAVEVAGEASATAVDEKAFRYPGPKPQTREAGVLLLSDGTEGAVRALKEKTPARIAQTVEGIINKSFAEGQLDECELTLKNLNEIGKAFTRILMGIYHQRIEYPRQALQLRDKDVAVMESSVDVTIDVTSTDDDTNPDSKRGIPH